MEEVLTQRVRVGACFSLFQLWNPENPKLAECHFQNASLDLVWGEYMERVVLSLRLLDLLRIVGHLFSTHGLLPSSSPVLIFIGVPGENNLRGLLSQWFPFWGYTDVVSRGSHWGLQIG